MLHKINIFRVLTFLIGLTVSQLLGANPIIPIQAQSAQPIVTPALPSIDANGYILIDADSGKILAEKNADGRMAPASLTKLMSLYIIYTALKSGSIHLDDKVHISTAAWKTEGSRMFVKVNTDVVVHDLIAGIAIASGNDASVAMAEYIAGTEDAFASMMNNQAKALGMTSSHFVDSTGLPNADHYSTPRDFATLTQALAHDFPEEYKLFAEKWFTYNGIRQPNRNRLLWRYQYADGLKTGHTDNAGYCLVASAKKEGMRLISVIMGAPSDNARTEDSIRLLTYGFRFYETKKLYKAGDALTQARIWRGKVKEAPLGLDTDWYATLPAGQAKNIQAKIELNEPLSAPIEKGKPYGKLNILLNDQIVASKPLVALASISKGGIFRSISDSVSFSWRKLFFSKPVEKANNG